MQETTTTAERDEYVNYKETERNVVVVHNSFDLLDERKRSMGAEIRTSEFTRTRIRKIPCGYECTISELGFFYRFIPHATRNGKSFGPAQFGSDFRTKAERDKAIKKYLESARKRAIKKGTTK
jgi:hypothetical protein